MEALGESDSFLEFQALLSRVAKVERPVLLMGEQGSAKTTMINAHTKKYNAEILLSERSYQLILSNNDFRPDQFEFLGQTHVKGKEQPIGIYRWQTPLQVFPEPCPT